MHEYGPDDAHTHTHTHTESPYKRVSDGTIVVLAMVLMLLSIIYHKYSFDKVSVCE